MDHSSQTAKQLSTAKTDPGDLETVEPGCDGQHQEHAVRHAVPPPLFAGVDRGEQGPIARQSQASHESDGDGQTEALRVLSEQLNLKFNSLEDWEVDSKLLASFPKSIVVRLNVVPLHDDGDVVEVATSDPYDFDGFSLLAVATQRSLVPVLAPHGAIKKLLNKQLGVASDTIDELVQQAVDDPLETRVEFMEEGNEQASVVRLVNQLLREAVDQRASDVHIEPLEDGLSLRFRIDGILRSQPVPAEISRFYAPMVTRLKIMAQLNIAEKRRPQDGRLQLPIGDREIDLRISTIPVLRGEGVVLRLLDKNNTLLSLTDMGLPKSLLGEFRRLIRVPHGILLVTGPTGSGKTTTLYSAIADIAGESVKIITAEDPVEYEVSGISQIQIQNKVDLTFASSLRSMLRHDPDVLLIGEIRDRETAESAVRAALTGHLVLSTLHTNDAASAYARLIEMGIEPFLVTSSVVGILAQRLVRRLCTRCRIASSETSALPHDFPASYEGSLWLPGGCGTCGRTGYRGRTGVFELLTVTDGIRDLCLGRASSSEIRARAVADGFHTMRQDGWTKAIAGTTTVAEVLRISDQETA